MAQILEGLIAKGRRVHLMREQREIAFGLADLSTHQELHHRIVTKGGIKTLIYLLTTSQDVETQRFSALALANTSCAELHQVDIASQENVVMHLTEYISNTEADLLGRKYCAMAIGNLATNSKNQMSIVDLGGIEALSLLLKFSSDEDDLDTGRYAAFALSNVASNALYHKQIVDADAIKYLITLACADNLDVQRQSLNALRGICISYEFREVMIDCGILDPLILIAQTEDPNIAREAAATLNCLSTVPERKQEVANRAISTVLSMLLSGDVVVERHACCIMANLSEMVEIHTRLLEEDGLPPLVSMLKSSDLNCKGEAIRAMANLSSNESAQHHLVNEEILHSLVQALTDSDLNYQRFILLCIANLANTVSSQIMIVKLGAIGLLFEIILQKESQTEARRYASLALATLSVTTDNHSSILQKNGLNALFSLSCIPDLMSQYYIGCTMANLSSNFKNHSFIVEQGGIQQLITMAYSSDHGIQIQVSAALRGLSASDFAKMKIVQEGGIEPLSRLLLKNGTELLREVTACFCNLSLRDENKIEIAKSSVIPPLIELMQFEDMEISCYSTACLANLAEVAENQELIASEGSIEPCQSAMRSNCIELQREGGRLLANLCACDVDKVSAIIVKNGGHKQLLSYLLSRDMELQRIGAFGIGNLCIHECHRVTLCDSGVLEPLLTLFQSDCVDLELQKFAMIAIVNLAADTLNHKAFLQERVLQLMISLSDTNDIELRQYAALTIVKLAKNRSLCNVITEEGGLEPVLYLARTEDDNVRRETLPAITALSFAESNRGIICNNGGLETIIQDIDSKKENGSDLSRLACCAMANLSESIQNHTIIFEANIFPLLNETLKKGSSSVKVEAARALGNLAKSFEYADILGNSESTLSQLISSLDVETFDCQRAISIALSNIATNIKSHSTLMEFQILNKLIKIFNSSLDPKCTSDHETCQVCLMLVANLALNQEHHSIIVETLLGHLVEFCTNRDIKCRQNAVIVLGNLCCNKQNLKDLIKAKVINILISFSFFSVDVNTSNTQYQALAGIRGIAIDNTFRKVLIDMGCLEPLILVAVTECSNVEIRREAAAALYNVSLSVENGMKMVLSGVVDAITWLLGVEDKSCQIFAVGTLANLAERGLSVQSRLLNNGGLGPLMHKLGATTVTCGVGDVVMKKQMFRCLALMALNVDSHKAIMTQEVIQCFMNSLRVENDTQCRCFIIHLIANLALFRENHTILIEGDVLASFKRLANVEELVIKRFVAFAFHHFCKNENIVEQLESEDITRSIAQLMKNHDHLIKIHSCLALKYITKSTTASVQFVEHEGLPLLLAVVFNEEHELKREVAAALRNLSITDYIKIIIVKEGGMEILLDFCQESDTCLCHQSCGVLANLAEVTENQLLMMKKGLLYHLKFVMRTGTTEVKRECLRAIANLSYDSKCNQLIVIEGGLIHVIQSLSSDDGLCRIYSAMTLSNLSTNRSNHNSIVEEGGLEPLLYTVSSCDIVDVSRQYAHFALTNLTATKSHQTTLVSCGFMSISCPFLIDSDRLLRLSAALCLSNLASNCCNHAALIESQCLNHFINSLSEQDRDIRFRAVSFFRGISSNSAMKNILIREDILQKLLRLALSQDVEIQIETLATLCNLSIDGYLGENAELIAHKVDMKHMVSFLCSSDATCQLFGAVSIGNILSERESNKAFEKLGQLIVAGTDADLETRRCIAYALCNLCGEESNRIPIVMDGGLIPIISLAYSDDPCDVLTSVSTIRGLASSTILQRELVVKGSLSPLFAAVESAYNKAIVIQALTAIAALSLDDDNKESIIGCDGFTYLLFECTKSEVDIAIVCFRILANCSENIGLHDLIIKSLIENTHILSKDYEDSHVDLWREVSRFCACLCSNENAIDTLLKINIAHRILYMIKHVHDEIVERNAFLGLLNLSIVSQYYQYPTLPDNLINPLFENEYTQSKTDEKVQIRRYAILAVGNIMHGSGIIENYSLCDIIQFLSKSLTDNDMETRFYVTFALHQLSMKRDNIHYLRDVAIEGDLLDYVSRSSLHLITYAISVIRLATLDDEKICKHVVDRDGLQMLANVVDDVSQEVKREISAIFCNLSAKPVNKFPIACSVAMTSIINLSHSKDVETSRFAIAAMANIAEDVKTHEVLFSKSCLHFALESMTRTNLSLKREASRLVSNILSTRIGHKIFIKANGLDIMGTLSRSQDKECQVHVSLSFDKISANPLNHDEIIKSGSLHVILHLGKLSENTMASYHALSALQGLSLNNDYKDFISQEGGLIVVLDLLHSTCIKIQILAAATLHNLSASSRLMLLMCDNGVLEAISKCVSSRKNETLLYHCAGIMANIAESQQGREYLFKQKVFQSSAVMISHESKRIQSQLVRTFQFISIKTLDGSSMDLISNFIKTTISFLSSSHDVVSSEAAIVIGNISNNSRRQKLVCELGAVKPLIRLLMSSEHCYVNVCRAISRITMPNENKLICVEDNQLLDTLIRFCSSNNTVLLTYTVMALCNLSSNSKAQDFILERNGVEALLSLIDDHNSDVIILRSVMKTLCNLAIKKEIRERIVHKGGIRYFYSMLQHENDDCIEFGIHVLSNLCVDRVIVTAVIKPGALCQLSSLINTSSVSNIQIAALKILYNISTTETSHNLLVKAAVLDSIKLLCKSENPECRYYSMMILANISANKTARNEAIRRGGLQSAILMLRDKSRNCVISAYTCLANMANNTLSQTQIVLHGGLSMLTINFTKEDCLVLLNSVSMYLINLAVNESNHKDIVQKRLCLGYSDVLKARFDEFKFLNAFIVSNLFSNDQYLKNIHNFDGISILVYMTNSDNIYFKCLAFASLRKMAITTSNRPKLIQAGILRVIGLNGTTIYTDIKREVSGLLNQLSQNAANMIRKGIIQKCFQTLIRLIESNDAMTIRNIVGTIGNLWENCEYHSCFKSTNVPCRLMTLLSHKCNHVRREALRATCNLLWTVDNYKLIISGDENIRLLVSLCVDSDQDCQYYAVSSCRKLALNQHTHKFLLEKAPTNFQILLKSYNFTIKKQALVVLRDLSACDENKADLATFKVVETLIYIIQNEKQVLQSLAIASLRHISTTNDSIKGVIVKSGAISILIKCVHMNSITELMQQISGLFANVSELNENHMSMVDAGILGAMLILSRAQHEEILNDVSRILANLSACEERQLVMYQEGGINCLMKLTERSHSICRRYISLGIQNLCTNFEVCKSIIKEMKVMSLLQLSELPFLDFKRTVAIVIMVISNNADGAMQLTNQDCIKTIIMLCNQDDLQIQRDSLCTLANIANSYNTHHVLINQGVLKLITSLSQSVADSIVVREIARFLLLISSNEDVKHILLERRTVFSLTKFARRSEVLTQRYATLALCNISLSRNNNTNSFENYSLMDTLMYLTRCADLEVERCTVLAIAAHALGADDASKQKIVDYGVLKPLVNMLKYPDDEIQQYIALTLSAIVTGQNDDIKLKLNQELCDLSSLWNLLKSENDECIHHVVHIAGSMLESNILRDTFALDCATFLSNVAISNNVKIKRVCGYVFSLLAEHKHHHRKIQSTDALHHIVNLAGLVDTECQLYGAFSLVHLAGSRFLHVSLVQFGAVRHLVSMMASESEPRHYAGFALLKLADNFENHIAIAKEGGIQALLKLGRNHTTDDDVQHKAALTMGNLASWAVEKVTNNRKGVNRKKSK